MALSSHALTTLDAVKASLTDVDNSSDTYLERQINAVSEFIEKYCNRHFEKKTYTEKKAGNGRQKICLDQFPIVSVTSVIVDGMFVDDYEVDEEAGMFYRKGRWNWQGDLIGLVGEPGASFPNIVIEYIAGYVLPKDETIDNERTLPYDLEDATIQLVVIRYEKRGVEHMKRETIGPLTTEFIDGIPPQILEVLDKYKKLVI